MWTDAQIALVSDEGSIQRGRDYARRGLVRELRTTTRTISAVVFGSGVYTVRLTARTWECSCPVGLEQWFCKHCVAVALTARGDSPQPADRGWPAETLEAQVAALRCRRFLDWREASQWAHGHEVTLAALQAAGRPELLQRAAKNVAATMRQADDSNGSIGDLMLGILDAHATACRDNPPKPAPLARWLLTFGIDDSDWWTIDVDDYTEALGAVGVQLYGGRPGHRCGR